MLEKHTTPESPDSRENAATNLLLTKPDEFRSTVKYGPIARWGSQWYSVNGTEDQIVDIRFKVQLELRDLLTKEQKDELRKVKDITNNRGLAVKAAVYGGNKGGYAMAVQFNKDLALYGLWEALLYVEGYEEDGYYIKGTAEKAVKAYFNS